MRNVNRWGLAAGLAAALALFGNARAQGSRAGSTAAGTGSSAQAGAEIDHGLQDKLERLHAVNQGEIKLGQLGVQNAQSPDVKQFAQKMETDHQRADQKLTAAAQSAGVASLEGKTFQKASDHAAKDVQSLQSKSGADFDKAFMDGMVKGHEKAAKTAQSAAQAAKKANQTELAATLDQAHTMIQGHLTQAKQIQKSLGGAGHAASSTPSGSTPSGAMSGTGSSGSGLTK